MAKEMEVDANCGLLDNFKVMYTTVSGEMMKEQKMVFINFQTVTYILEHGKMNKEMVKASKLMKMGTHMKESG